MKISLLISIALGFFLPPLSAAQEPAEESLINGTRLLTVASANNPQTCMLMGMCYYYGLGIGQDIPQAIKWYTLGAESGHDGCMRELARLYRLGVLVPEDPRKAYHYMVQAFKAGNESAQLMLAWQLFTGEFVKQDRQLAFRLFTRAAQAGNEEAFFWVGNCYAHGLGVEKDVAVATEWWAAGAMKGANNCKSALAYAYARGEGVTRDLALADYLLNSGIADGQHSMKLQKEMIHRALAVAPQPIDKLAELSAEACLDQHYYYSFAVEGQRETANKWLLRAAELGNPRAVGLLVGDLLLCAVPREEIERWLPALQRAAQADDPIALLSCAGCYGDGLATKMDVVRASEYLLQYTRLAEDSSACFAIADAYMAGVFNGKPDIAQALVWCRRAADLGHDLAQEALPTIETLARSAQKSSSD